MGVEVGVEVGVVEELVEGGEEEAHLFKEGQNLTARE